MFAYVVCLRNYLCSVQNIYLLKETSSNMISTKEFKIHIDIKCTCLVICLCIQTQRTAVTAYLVYCCHDIRPTIEHKNMFS